MSAPFARESRRRESQSLSVSFGGPIRVAVLEPSGTPLKVVEERECPPGDGEGLSLPLYSSPLLLPPPPPLNFEVEECRLELRGRGLLFPFAEPLQVEVGGGDGLVVALNEIVGEGGGPRRVLFGARSPF